jgi:hypothetical protein
LSPARYAAFFLISVIALTLGATSCAPATSATPTGGSPMPASIVDPYLKIQTALAADSVDGVRANAGDLATAVTALGSPAFKIATAATTLTSAGELDDARQKFGTLSDAIVTYMDGLHLTLPDGVHVATCSTAPKPWLQAGDAIANPYTGPSSPCGAFR